MCVCLICSQEAPDDEKTVLGMRYPPSWGQHQSMSPQGSSNKIPKGFDDSFHSAESHYGIITLYVHVYI